VIALGGVVGSAAGGTLLWAATTAMSDAPAWIAISCLSSFAAAAFSLIPVDIEGLVRTDAYDIVRVIVDRRPRDDPGRDSTERQSSPT
jgi:hypothetical protein